ncbi:MAG: hypothetical protein D6758_06245 [Gammaproteobacteria bacterium]|nr:MAG: hypothetical protein D6758_06245 [Gammaproteobacteria bacterium]
MSYILDALKKSERERRDEALPDPLIPGGLGLRRRRRSSVLPLVVLVIGVGALASGLTFWWVGRTVQMAPADASGTQPSQNVPAPYSAPQRDVSRTQSQPTAQPVHGDASEPVLTSSQPAEEGPTPTDEKADQDRPLLIEPGKKPRYLDRASDEMAGTVSAGQTTEIPVQTREVPVLSELPLSFQRRVPNLTFNSHIYSPDATASRVMINNLYLRPGQSVAGMRLVAVTEEGVVLELDGTRFRVPVVRDWVRPE